MKTQLHNKTFEIVNITRRCFPKGRPIVLAAAEESKVTLRRGDCVVWRELDGVVYLLRNAQWFKKLTVHFVKPGDKHGNH
jgi:hypothetical protein